jgi:hypothetical protein
LLAAFGTNGGALELPLQEINYDGFIPIKKEE